MKLPPRFIQDCQECGCDVGEYRKGHLYATSTQLAELRSRALYYVDGADAAPPGLINAAHAVLRAMTKIFDKHLTIIEVAQNLKLKVRDNEGQEATYFPSARIRHDLQRMAKDNDPQTLVGLILRYEPSGPKGLPILQARRP